MVARRKIEPSCPRAALPYGVYLARHALARLVRPADTSQPAVLTAGLIIEVEVVYTAVDYLVSRKLYLRPCDSYRYE